LDVGGTNLRVVGISMDGKGGITVDDKVSVKCEIPKEVQEGDSKALFDLLADNVESVTKEGKLGFTFSFPVQQKSISSGILMRWTKGFITSGVVGEDLCKLLNKALEQRDLSVHVDALINDTVGTLIAGAYTNPTSRCVVGLILGTGANTCYWEKQKNMTKYLAENGITDVDDNAGMVINMESGNFGSTPERRGQDLPLTEFDELIDNESNNKGCQLLEKQISGMYLGELVRRILQKYLPKIGDKLPTAYSFETVTISEIISDESSDLSLVTQLLANVGVSDSTLGERQFVKSVSFLVGKKQPA